MAEMDDQTPDAVENAEDQSAAAEVKGGRRLKLVLSLPVIFAIGTALLLNVVGLVVILVTSSANRDSMEGRMRALAKQAAKPAPRLKASGDDHAAKLLEIANELHAMGRVDSARRLRAAAQRLLMDKEGELGAFRLAVDLLEEGRTREARRAFYRILACGDQPGTGWGPLATRSRFLIGASLSEEADRIEDAPEGDS
jgi:hypothetical protein